MCGICVDIFWNRDKVWSLAPFPYTAKSVKVLPPRLQHKGAIREGKADFSQPDTYCTRVDVWSRIHHYHLQHKAKEPHNDIEHMQMCNFNINLKSRDYKSILCSRGQVTHL